MNLSEMRRWMDARGLQLTRSLGQNFLHDGNQLRRIVAAAELSGDDSVLEIGPGLGPLTGLLLDTAKHVTAVEVDARLVAALRDRFPDRPGLELIHADALEWLRGGDRDWSGTKLVSNLPYSVGSPILVELALADRPPSRMVVTLQWEVIQRLMARPDHEHYGILTLLAGIQFTPGSHFKIPRDCFFPAPDVDSACLTLLRRTEPLVPPSMIPVFVRVVKQAFSQRRKMMRKLLCAAWPSVQVEAALEAAGIPRDARAETVDIGRFAILTRHLQSGPV